MSKETQIDIHFSLPFSAKRVFDFIILPKNMPLYEGYGLVPGIKNVRSSDAVRREGTIDFITNTDGSSHQSKTDFLEAEKRYALTLSHIKIPGLKEKLGNPLMGFLEDWIFRGEGEKVHIERTLVIIYREGIFNHWLVHFLIKPQMRKSLLRHHENLLVSIGASAV